MTSHRCSDPDGAVISWFTPDSSCGFEKHCGLQLLKDSFKLHSLGQ